MQHLPEQTESLMSPTAFKLIVVIDPHTEAKESVKEKGPDLQNERGCTISGS